MGSRGSMLALGFAVLGGVLALGSVAVADDPPPPAGSPTTTFSTQPPPAANAQDETAPDGESGDDPGIAPAVASPEQEASPAPTRSDLAAASDPSVSIRDGASTSQYRFSPSSITISVGEAVTWTNDGHVPEGHTVSGSGFNSPTLHAGDTYTHTFNAPGTFDYVCSIHPFMKGTVNVEGAAPGGGSGGGTGGGSGTSANSGSEPGSSSVSESAAGASPDAAGSADELPATGLDALPLLLAGTALLVAGLVVRRLAAPERRSGAKAP